MLRVLLRPVGNNDKDYKNNYNYDLIMTDLIITKTMSMRLYQPSYYHHYSH